MLDLRQIRNFVVVAERLSISRAAAIVNLSQPALSRQIQALEKQVGVALFARAGNRIDLTAEGEDLLERAIALLDEANALLQRSGDLREGTVGHLRVGATPQTIARLVSPAMARFRATHPGVTFAVSEADNDGLLEMVETGRVHLAIAAFGGDRGLAGVKLFQAALRIVVPCGHALARAESVDLADIAGEDIVVLRRGFLTRQLFDLACARAGVRPTIVLESSTAGTLAALAADGHGIAVISTSAALRQDDVAAVPLHDNDEPITGDVYALWNSGRHQPSCLREFITLLSSDEAAS